MIAANSTATGTLIGLMLSTTTIRTVLRALNNGSALAVVVFFIGTTIFSWCTLKNEDARPLSKWRKRTLVGLSFIVSLGYAAQALSCIPWLSSVSDDILIHSIAHLLLWVSLTLILWGSSSPVPLVWIGTALLNFILDGFICVLTFQTESRAQFLVYVEALQTITLVVLATFTTLAVFFLIDFTTREHGEETQSLLFTDVDSVSSSATNAQSGYNTLSHSQKSSSGSDADGDEDNDSDSDEDDDKSIRVAQKQRLAQSGGWVGYLAAFKVFAPYVLPYNDLKLQIYFVILLILTGSLRVLNVLHPRQYGIIIDKLTRDRQIPWADVALWLVYQLAASDCGVEALSGYIENRLEQSSLQKLTIASVEHVMSLSMNFHDDKDSAEVIKAVDQAGSLHEILKVVVLEIGPAFLDILVAFWYVTHLFDIYALFILIAMGIGFVFAVYHITILITLAKRISSQKERDQSKLTFESIGNWFTISCFNQKAHTMSRVSRAVKGTAKADLRSDDLYVYMFAAQDIFERPGQVAITILGASRVVRGMSSVGDLVTLQNYWSTIMMPLWVLTHKYRTLNSSLVGAERLLQLFNESPKIKDSIDAKPITNVMGAVAFDNVEFAYEGREPIIRNFSMTARPGQTIALVGETGSGKSTLIKLLMRFYDTTKGSITIDGHDLRSLTLDSLRDCFGFVPQDSILFNMSIMENVRFGRLDATDQEVFDACRAASIHDKIIILPKGYATLAGERGIKLSGGERQRIAIARVFLKNAPIVLLDEATSAMDSQTESKIQGAVKRLISGRTTFTIAHRLSTIVEADCILVVDRGQVVESGSHAELIQKRGRYFDLWSKQASVTS